MLKRQPPEPNDAPAMLVHEWTTAPISDGKKYLERHFPQTTAALFSKSTNNLPDSDNEKN
jgi:hypothetical protein